MSAWPTVLLGDICEFKYGKSLPAKSRHAGRYPVYGSNGVVDSHAEHVVSGPAIVIGRKGSVGEVHYSTESCWPIDTTYFVDNVSSQCDLKWLYYRLKNLGLTSLNRAAAIPGLNRSDAYRKTFPLPPIEQQRRTVRVLDQVDVLRLKRRETIALLDELTQSIFLDMFGDPVKNERGWGSSTILGSITDITSGITKGRRAGSAVRSVPYLAVANVQAGQLDLANIKEIDATEDEISKYRLHRDDILLTEGGDPDKLGRGTIWNDEINECIHQNHIFRVRLKPNAEFSPVFLQYLIASRRGVDYFFKSSKQTTGIASINKRQLRELPLLAPPFHLQQEFARRVTSVKQLKLSHQAHLAELDALFASLQHHAFRGELWDDAADSAA